MGTTSSQPNPRDRGSVPPLGYGHLTGQEIWMILGVLAGILSMVFLVNPRVLILRPVVKYAAAVVPFIAASVMVLLHWNFRPLKCPAWLVRRLRVDRLTAGLLAFMFFAMSILLISWEPPTAQQVEQQLLANRGMFLRRVFYKTALENGDAHAVASFHNAGFEPSLAFALMGERAQTQPDRWAIDVVLALPDSALEGLVRELAKRPRAIEGEPTDAISTLQPIDTMIGYRETELTSTDTTSAFPMGPRSEEPGDGPLHSRGLTLLGHALRRQIDALVRESDADTTTPVETLLRLGANPALAMMRLLSAGNFHPRLSQLAVDPFIYFAYEPRITRRLCDIGLRPSTRATNQCGPLDPPSSPSVTCGGTTFYPKASLVGYREANGKPHALAAFKGEQYLGCAGTVLHIQGSLSWWFLDSEELDVGSREAAVLRITSAYGDPEVPIAVISSLPEDNQSRHYVGAYTAESGLLDVRTKHGSPERLVMVTSSESGDTIWREIRKAAELPEARRTEIECPTTGHKRLTEATQSLTCEYPLEIGWSLKHRPHLVYVDSLGGTASGPCVATGGEFRTPPGRCLRISSEGNGMELAAGKYTVSVAALSTLEGSPVELPLEYRVAPPQATSREHGGARYLWPESEAVAGYISPHEKEFVHLELLQIAHVSLQLSGLTGDVDLYLDSSLGDNLDGSDAGGAREERIDTTLFPGRYLVRLIPFDGASRYVLGISKALVDSTPLGKLSPDGPTEHEVINPSEQGEVFEFEVTEPLDATIDIVEPAEGSVLQLFDEDGKTVRTVEGSVGFRGDLGPGRHFVRIQYPSGTTDYEGYRMSVRGSPRAKMGRR